MNCSLCKRESDQALCDSCVDAFAAIVNEQPRSPYEHALVLKIARLERIVNDAAKLDEAGAKIEEARLAKILQAQRAKAREELAHELKAGRARLRRVIADIKIANDILSHVQAAAHHPEEYPLVPTNTVPATEYGSGLPLESGVYFVWSGSVVVYIGQSICIAKRACVRNHESIRHGDQISWLPLPKEQLNWAESFYIGRCRPTRNFGGRA